MKASNYEVGEGWVEIVNDTIKLIEGKIDSRFKYSKLKDEKQSADGSSYSHEKCPVKPELIILQIKEKFGGLRMYMAIDPNYDKFPSEFDEDDYKNKIISINGFMDGTVSYAELLASRTCEFTGATGKLHVKNGWMKTVSPEYAKENGFSEMVPIEPEE